MAVFSEKLYDKVESELAEYIQKNSRNGFVYIEFTYKQIGMDEAWYKDVCATLNWDKIKIKREILLQRIRGNSKSPFDPDDVDEINSYRTHPIEEHIIHNDFLLRVYRPIDKAVPYIIGVDCATGTNNDSTVATFVDPYTLCPVAIIKSPLIDEPDAAEILIELIMRFAPKAVLAIERNNIGSSIINIIRRTKYATRLYNDPTKMDNTPDDKLDRTGQLEKKANNSRHWGIYTEGKSRERMMQILLLRVKDNKDGFVCNEIIDDINNLIQKSNGRIEAESGKHDDCIMSYLIALYTYMNGYKLSRYGIIKGLKRDVVEEIQNKEPTYEDLYKALPAEWQAIMPKPGGSLIATDISADIGLPQNMFDGVGTKEDDAIYQQIMSVQQRRRMHKLSVDPDNADIDNEYIEEMVKQAQNKERGGFTHAQFDIAKILSR